MSGWLGTITIFPYTEVQLKILKSLLVPWNQLKHQKLVWYQFLILKKWNGPSLNKILWKISDFNFSSLGPLIRGAPFLFWLSCLPEWPNQLAYFTFISGFVCKFPESVEKLKICLLGLKLWPPELGVKKILEFQKSNVNFRWYFFISKVEFDPSFFIIWDKFLDFQIRFRFWHRDTR